MTKTMKRTLSLVLVIAMVFSLGITALAADTISLDYTQVSKRVGSQQALTPLNATGTVTWTYDSNYVSLSGGTAGSNGAYTTTNNTTVTVTALKATSGTTVTATCNGSSASCVFTITANTVSSFDIKQDDTSVTGKTLFSTVSGSISLTTAAAYDTGAAANGSTTWAVSDNSVLDMTANGSAAAFSILKAGSATVTAKWTSAENSSVTKTASVTIKSTTVTGVTVSQEKSLKTVTAGETLALTAAPTDTSGKAVTNYSSVVWTSGDPSVATVSGTGLSGTVKGVKASTAKVAVTCTVDGVKSSEYLITVSGASKEIDVSTTKSSDLLLNGARSSIASYFYSVYGVSLVDTDTIKITVPTSGSGIVYANSSKSSTNKIATGNYTMAQLSAMCFEPASVGDYLLKYSVTKDSNTLAGTIKITVNHTIVNAAATVPMGGSAFAMDATNGYTANSITSQIKAGVGADCYVVFVLADVSGTTCGTFSPAKDTAYYTGTGLMTGTKLSTLSFTPSKNTTGTYSIGYTAHSSSTISEDNIIASGRVSFTVKDENSGSVSVYYNVKTSGTVSLNEDDFIAYYQSVAGTAYSLTSVKFDSVVAKGTLEIKNGLINSSVGTTTEYYTKDHAVTNGKLLNDVKYAAGTATGCYPVSFTCTGKYGTTTRTVDGTLYLCVTKGEVSGVAYNVAYGTEKAFNEADFAAVYATATGKANTTDFTVMPVAQPAMGIMYRGSYIASVNTYYNVNAKTDSAYDVSDLSYIPGNYTTGSDKVVYKAFDSTGTLMYIDTVTFNYKDSVNKIICGAEGYTFKVADFVGSTDKDPVVSVSFTKPASIVGGALYSDYAYGTGTPIISTTNKFTTAANGTITKVTYIPRANEPIDVVLKYTATTKAGNTISGSYTMAYTTRATALKFTDVTAAWAIPAVDYCSQWGIVSGVGGSSFNPNGTMQRGMLVTMLYRMAGQPSGTTTNPFKDISSSDYYYSAVLWAYSKGIVSGTSKTTFSPKTAISRQDIATMLYNYECSMNGTPTVNSGYLSSFADAGSISGYAQNAMSWAVSHGVMSGSGNRLTPTATGSRAQVASMLHRYLAS